MGRLDFTNVTDDCFCCGTAFHFFFFFLSSSDDVTFKTRLGAVIVAREFLTQEKSLADDLPLLKRPIG